MQQNSLKKAVSIMAIAAVMGFNATVTAAEVDEETRRVGKGFGIGAAIGSVVAGPVGLVVGSVAGAVKVQQDIRDERLLAAEAERIEAEAELVEARSALSEMEENLVAATETKGLYEPGVKPGGVSLEVMFRTASSEVSDRDRARLGELAASVSAREGLTIHLEGFSDPRGDADYNLRLSERRVDAVKQALVEQGAAAGRIRTVAHGEALADTSERDIDGLALERRVSVTLRDERASKGVARLDL